MNPLEVAPALYVGRVMHNRPGPPAHRFEYPLFMWLLDAERLGELPGRLPGFGYNRRRPIAFFDEDHFGGGQRPVVEDLKDLLAANDVAWPGGPVWALTHCRVLGYVFNPVSVWYCSGPDGILQAVVAEVNNTFGERHCYVASRAQWASNRDRCSRSTTVRWDDKKVFHVSPFFTLDGSYRFAVAQPGDHLGLRIDLTVGGEVRLKTALALRREPLSRSSVARVLVRYPLMTAHVMASIHWQALRLWRKGAIYHSKPPYDPAAARQGVR